MIKESIWVRCWRILRSKTNVASYWQLFVVLTSNAGSFSFSENLDCFPPAWLKNVKVIVILFLSDLPTIWNLIFSTPNNKKHTIKLRELSVHKTNVSTKSTHKLCFYHTWIGKNRSDLQRWSLILKGKTHMSQSWFQFMSENMVNPLSTVYPRYFSMWKLIEP